MVADAPMRLIGIGVGPGDSELLTIKAVNALRSADVIFVPQTEMRSQQIGRAEEIVLEQLPDKRDAIKRIPFAMSERSGVGQKRLTAWQVSANAALEAFNSGARNVAFATIGDPSVFSTFSYLCDLVVKALPQVSCEVIPGITAMQALAAASGIPLCQGKEILALVPATVGCEKLAKVLEVADSLTIYKGGTRLGDIRQLLSSAERQRSVLGTDIGLANQQISELSDIAEDQAPYFSTILSIPMRKTTGDKL